MPTPRAPRRSRSSVVGHDQILVADPELARAGGERISSRDLDRHRIISVNEVMLPVDEGRTGDMPDRILGVFGVR